MIYYYKAVDIKDIKDIKQGLDYIFYILNIFFIWRGKNEYKY